MSSATITRLPGSAHPWAYALRIRDVEGDIFYALIEDLKAYIPGRHRKYDPPTKRWLVKEGQLDTLIDLLKRYNLPYQCEGAGDGPRTHRMALDATTAARTLYVQENAPLAVIQAAYRALAKMTHPDAGGSNEAMQKVNEAYEVLTK